MYKKYENKTYTESAQNDVSDLEIKKNNFVLKNKTNNNTDTEQNNKKQITFQPKCIFTKQNNNISFYQSNSKNSRRTSTNNKDLSPLPDGKKPTTQKINSLSQSQNFGEEKFSYNYTSLKRENSNKINKKVSKENNQRINIDEINTKYQKPQRTIKSYKKQFNEEKSDNFNMLSYRPMEYDSDINLNLNKERPKIIPIYKKQEVDEIFYPSKRTHSPQAPAENEEIKDKYQTHTLKYQSFCGSFNCSKNSRVAKSTSKINANQLNDFNIDKLIEIGDKYVKFGKPVLPLGKILNNNIINYNNRIKTKKKIPINSKQFNTYYSYEVQPIPNFSKYSKKSENKIIDKNNEDLNNNITKDKNRVSKKIISKNILKNTKLDNSNQIINTELSQKRNSRKNTKKVHKNNLEKKEENQNIEEKEENEKIKKKRANLNSNQKHIGISDNNKSEKNYIITNIRNEEQNTQNILTEQKLLTDDEGKNRTKIKSNEKKIVSNKNILVTECKKYNKNNRVVPSNLYYKDNKQKNYYGFDERHNLEDTIDNHAYYESIHSKKKISNLCIDKVI